MSDKLEREIRGIQRQYRGLKAPIRDVERLDPQSEPQGLRVGSVGRLVFPHEGILDAVLNFAQSVWHFKDYLKDHAPSQRKSVETFADHSIELKTCADLANAKKHATLDRPRSGLSPNLGVLRGEAGSASIGVVEFDTSRSGMVEFAYNGKTKAHRFWVTNLEPIRFRVDLLVSTPSGLVSRGDAVEFIYSAFEQWQTFMEQHNIHVRRAFVGR